ncbi:hypothetical protein HEP74_02292 [Xanthomonas sp. SS]|nr:hypothetical protein HEP74_02292 [Xanthomonas sp. SS]
MAAHTASIPARNDQPEPVTALASALAIRLCSLQARAYVRQGHMDLLREHAFSVVQHHQAPPAGRVQRYQLELAPPPPELPPPEEEEPPLELLDDEEEEEDEDDEEVDVRLA